VGQESLPHTNAVIHGVKRLGNILPMSAPSEVTVDTILAGDHALKVTRHSQAHKFLKPDFEFIKGT
jgi:hypothetical protein